MPSPETPMTQEVPCLDQDGSGVSPEQNSGIISKSPSILKQKSEGGTNPLTGSPPCEDDDVVSSSSTSGSGSISSPCQSETSADAASEGNWASVDPLLLTAVRSSKDRLFVLKLDQRCDEFLKDASQTRLEFPQMNSYQRLIVHRVAQYFKLVHVADSARRAVVLYKNADSETPCLRLCDIPLDASTASQSAVSSIRIMQRHSHHHNHSHNRASRHSSTDSGSEGANGPSGAFKSIEEREAAYQAARARIFQEDSESDVSSTSRTSNQSNSTTGKSTARSGKHHNRSQASRLKQQPGAARGRGQQFTPQGGVPFSMPPSDYARVSPYYAYDNGPRGGYPLNPSNGIRPNLRGHPPAFEAMYGSGAPPPFNTNGPMPSGTRYMGSYVDWNGTVCHAQGESPGQSVQEPKALDSINNPFGTASIPAPYPFARPDFGIPPYTSPFTASHMDGVALHYYPEIGTFVPGPMVDHEGGIMQHGSAPGLMGPNAPYAGGYRETEQGGYVPQQKAHFPGGRDRPLPRHDPSFSDFSVPDRLQDPLTDCFRPTNPPIYHSPDPRPPYSSHTPIFEGTSVRVPTSGLGRGGYGMVRGVVPYSNGSRVGGPEEGEVDDLISGINSVTIDSIGDQS
ncbi:uncharacterized protein SPPG_07906 [Spizellomyces punctatus DAOM BR117]|uniref:SUZ domain-containing protein n=1 Tax=Spizellomyces punctatus (strain DAOM BR117) TaxID=645134 RepID=A0A0L0H6V3_SPIPD|nr:uncharacterized protein SPPG_07906 [Spizellomyces punctatus DAOM BR117]KNC96694.1 hypothetical protein SPPG_07906 [Spizellomyces punctatus DAOM BR117]|eukprot:XP_016604734.1 hypothetical protein SPPG_07906 [Spizellomyces punctatus DAOM BR117]